MFKWLLQIPPFPKRGVWGDFVHGHGFGFATGRGILNLPLRDIKRNNGRSTGLRPRLAPLAAGEERQYGYPKERIIDSL